MIKKTVLLIFAVMILQCAMSTGAAAQTNNACLSITTWSFPDPVPPGWSYYAPYPAPFVYLIAAFTASCSPKRECHCTKAPDASAGAPIQLADGNTYIDQTDVVLPGLGGGLALRRKWNSVWPSKEIGSSIGIFGRNWRSTYEERVFMGTDNWLKYSSADGSYWFFGLDSVGGFVASGGGAAGGGGVVSFSAPMPTIWTLTFPSGEQRQFNSSTGLLTAIIDRNGNKTQITYDSNNRLSTVTDPVSRHLYFNYPNGSNLVSSVTSDFGVSLSYIYDGQGRLSQVTRPDLTTVTFTFDAQSNITAVTDQNGKILESHSYDSNGRGLTASQANGVNAVTVTYPQ